MHLRLTTTLSLLALCPVAVGQRQAIQPESPEHDAVLAEFELVQQQTSHALSDAVRATFDPHGAFDNDPAEKVPSTEVSSEPDPEYMTVKPRGSGGGGSGGSFLGGPFNDDCSNAAVISGYTYNPPLLNTTGATTGTCEPDHSCAPFASHGVWYEFTAPADGYIDVNTFGSTNYDTVVSIYDGCGFQVGIFCVIPDELACNSTGIFLANIQGFEATEGLTYLIKVSDAELGGSGGTLDFNFEFRPINDICSEATEVLGVAYDPGLIFTETANIEICESQESCEFNNVGVSNTVYYKYTPPCDGLLSVNTNGSNYDTVLSVWDGCGLFVSIEACDPANQIACDDDSGTGLDSQINDLPVVGGQAYIIKVSDYNTTDGGGWLDFNLLFEGNNEPIADISTPSAFACVCGTVSVSGFAKATGDGDIKGWELEARALSGSTWSLIASSETPVDNDVIAFWNASGFTEGYYLLRLTVENPCGITNTDVEAVYVNQSFSTAEIRTPSGGNIVGRNVCVDGTAWDVCFDNYRLEYASAGQSSFSPIDPGTTVYTSSVVNEPLGVWNTVDQGIPDGAYDLRVVGRDECGNEGSAQVTVVVDNTPPVSEITSPQSCTQLSPGMIQVRGIATDANLTSWVLQYTGGDQNSWVNIAQGTSPVNDGPLGTWDTSNLPHCGYTLRLIAYDGATINCNNGQWTEYTLSVSVGLTEIKTKTTSVHPNPGP